MMGIRNDSCTVWAVPPRRTVPAILSGLAIVTGLVLVSCGGSSSAPVTPQSDLVDGAATVAGLHPQGETSAGLKVIRVVDGDTLHVRLDGREVTVRLIGINTPETVKPDTPVECYGPEASNYAKSTLAGQRVTLEFDDSQGRLDQYGRMLAYVWLEKSDGQLSFVNLDEVARGYARERQYGPTPYAWKSTFRAAADTARTSGAGLWGACPA
jgi:micrococcal nuclease